MFTLQGDLAAGQTSPEQFAVQVKTINLIQTTATALCPQPIETSQRTSTEVTGSVHAELPALIRSIVNVGGTTAAKYQSVTTQGVLAADLAGVIKSAMECRLKVVQFLSDKMLGGPPPPVVVNQPIAPSTPVVERKQLASLPPRSNLESSVGLTIRVFPKANLTPRETIALARLLPKYAVQTGKSDIDPANYADTLFVNRDRVSPSEVVATARALAEIGVTIKSVQQMPVGGRREIQVGTALNPDTRLQAFAQQAGLNLATLSQLQGTEFWKQAFSGGPVYCFDKIGYARPCTMDEDGRPIK